MKYFFLIFILSTALFAQNSRIAIINETGSFIKDFSSDYSCVLDNSKTTWVSAGNYELSWTYHDASQIGQKCEVGRLDGTAYDFVSFALNSPSLYVFPYNSNTPAVTYAFDNSTYPMCTGAWNANVYAAIVQGRNKLYKFSSSSSSTPDWIYDGGSAAISDVETNWNGSYIIAGAKIGQQVALIVFRPDSATPLYTLYPSGSETSFRQIRISKNSKYGYMGCSTKFYVWDLETGVERGSGNTPASVDAHAISGNGDYIAIGFGSLYLYKWNGTAYNREWTASGSGSYFYAVGLNDDGSRVFGQLWNISANTRKFVYYNSSSSTPVWTYDYPASGGSGQNVPSSICSDQAGNYVITTTWGTSADENEVAILDIENQQLAFSVNSPGSMFSSSISPTGDYALATGKAVHANVSGRGTDTYAITSRSTGFKTFRKALPAWGGLRIYPNPVFDKLNVIYSSRKNDEVIITIYDICGKRIAEHKEKALETGKLQRILNMEACAAGVYHIVLKMNGKIIQNRRFTVIK
ncbi:MAG: T9SS type A sorting domain-containing protein [Candidatus Coatesbacteria bacterium]|nr:T9SS type A sorting domain-containing protein [Candidatus Coatesbacteria bacterium]